VKDPGHTHINNKSEVTFSWQTKFPALHTDLHKTRYFYNIVVLGDFIKHLIFHREIQIMTEMIIS